MVANLRTTSSSSSTSNKSTSFVVFTNAPIDGALHYDSRGTQYLSSVQLFNLLTALCVRPLSLIHCTVCCTVLYKKANWHRRTLVCFPREFPGTKSTYNLQRLFLRKCKIYCDSRNFHGQILKLNFTFV